MSDKPITWGPGFPGRETRTDATVGRGAEIALDTRRDRATLEGIWPATLEGTDGSGAVKGLAYHQGGDGVSRRLSASGGRIRLNGVEQKGFDGSTVTVADAPVVFAQLEGRTYFVDGTNALRFYDIDAAAPNTIYTIALPDAPDTPTGSAVAIAAKSVDAMDDATDWTGTGGLSGVDTDNSPLGGTSVHVDTTSDLAVGDTLTKTVAAQDWSRATYIEFDIYSGGREKATGGIYNFLCGEAAATENVIEFVVPQAQTKQTRRIPLWNIPAENRNAITVYGFQAATDQASVVWIKDLRFVGGVTGTKRYVLTATDTKTSGDAAFDVQSAESGELDVPTGDNGLAARLILPEPDDGTSAYKIWRLDLTNEGEFISTRYHYTATVYAGDTYSAASITEWAASTVYAAAATVVATVRNGAWWTTTAGGTSGTAEPAWLDDDGKPLASVTDGTVVWTWSGMHAQYDDVALDVTENLSLSEARTGPPVGASCVGIDGRRVALGKGADVWWGNADDPTTFYDITPADALELDITDADGGRLPMGSRVVAIANQGITTSGIIEGATLVFTEDDVIRLKGDTLADVDISWRRASGLSGPYGWTRDQAGNIYWFDRTGDVRSLGETLEPQTLSGDMAGSFQTADTTRRGEWVMVYEPQAHRLLCFVTPDAGTWAGHVLHLAEPGGWDDVTVSTARIPPPYSAAISGSGDAAYAVVGGDGGKIQRAMDTTPGLTPVAWTYQTGQVDFRERARIVEARGRVEGGSAAFTVMLDGGTVSAFTAAARFRQRFGLNIGRVLAVKVQGGAGTALRDLAALPSRRGEAVT